MSKTSARLVGALARAITMSFRHSRLVVLIYHSVLDKRDGFRPGDATAKEFDAHMQMLAQNFNCLTFGEAIAEFAEREAPSNSVVVTFDDGYRDNHDRAMPILRSHGLPATFFVASGYLEGSMMWNDVLIESLRSAIGQVLDLSDYDVGSRKLASESDAVELSKLLIKKVKKWQQGDRADFVSALAERVAFKPAGRLMMDEAEVRSLHKAGMEIGAHTVTHPILSTLSREASRQEISTSKAALEGIIGHPVSSFAYPNGQPTKDFLERDVEIVKEVGFSAAATTTWGCVSTTFDRFLIPRQSIWGCSAAKLPLQMLRNFRGVTQ